MKINSHTKIFVLRANRSKPPAPIWYGGKLREIFGVGIKVLAMFSLLAVGCLLLVNNGCGSSGTSEDTTTSTTSSSTSTAASSTTTSTGNGSTTTTSTTSSTTTSTTTTSSTTTTTMTDVPVQITYHVMNTAEVSYPVALGNLNPPAHVLPTRHMYYTFANPDAVSDVFAPASGTLTSVRYAPLMNYPGPFDYQLNFKYSDSCRFYLDHVETLEAWLLASVEAAYHGPLPENQNGTDITVSVPIPAGQKIGITAGRGSSTLGAMDLGIIDYNVTNNGLIDSDGKNYYYDTIHKVSPISDRYCSGAILNYLQTNVNRTNTGTYGYGKCGYDVAGKLVGNWFASDIALSGVYDYREYHETQTIAFVYDNYHPDKQVFSIGGEFSFTPGKYAVQNGTTSFEAVSTASGLVSYELYNRDAGGDPAGAVQGYCLVKMLTDASISVEVSASPISNFTASVKTFIR